MGCKTYQAFNPRNKAWVKYKLEEGRFVPIDVKQHMPQIPFSGVPKRGRRR